MAKELPFFKFNASEWISGEITLEDLTTQGAFINICAFYWFKSGCLTLTEIKRRLKLKQATIDNLLSGGHIKVNGDSVEITFLREQFDDRGFISKRNSQNGSKGGAPKGNKNAEKNNREQPETTNIEREVEVEEEREEEKKKKEKNVTLRAFDLPFDSIEFQTAWVEWEQYRKEKKQKITPSTAKKQIQFLGARGQTEAIAIINQSITNGWTGLFELKTNNNGKGTKQGNKLTPEGSRDRLNSYTN